jgi:hypothetical protein
MYYDTAFLRSVLDAANVVPSPLILVVLMMEKIGSSETLVFTIAIWRNIPEDYILHSPCGENLNSYIALTGCAL